MLTVYFALFLGLVQLSSGWTLTPYCESQGGNRIFQLKISSGGEWRKVIPYDTVMIQGSKPMWWKFQYSGTVLDDNGEYIVRLRRLNQKKLRMAKVPEWNIFYVSPKSLESKLADGSVQIKLKDGITKLADGKVKDPENGPQRHFWVSNKIDKFDDKPFRINDGKKLKPDPKAHTDIELLEAPATSVDPFTGEIDKEVMKRGPQSKLYPEQNVCTPLKVEPSQVNYDEDLPFGAQFDEENDLYGYEYDEDDEDDEEGLDYYVDKFNSFWNIIEEDQQSAFEKGI